MPLAAGRVLLLALAWGSTFLWIDLSLRAGLSPAQVTTARCLVAVASLTGALMLARAPWPSARHWPDLAVAALFCNVLPFLLFSVGQQTVSSGTAGILNATTPLWSVVLGLMLGHDRRRPVVHYVGLALGYLGVVALLAPGDQGLTPGGGLLIAGAAASYAIAFTWMGRRLTNAGVPVLSLATGQMLLATLMSLFLLPWSWASPAGLDGRLALAVLPLGVVCTALSFYLTVRMIATEGATNAASVGYLLPVVALVLGAMVLHEPVSVSALVGMTVVLVGVAMTRLAPGRANRRARLRSARQLVPPSTAHAGAVEGRALAGPPTGPVPAPGEPA